jgi:predicted transcriptional regulator
MKPTSKSTRVTVRLDEELDLNLSILQQATSTDKSKIIRMILKDFFDNNEELLNQYYEKVKTR